MRSPSPLTWFAPAALVPGLLFLLPCAAAAHAAPADGLSHVPAEAVAFVHCRTGDFLRSKAGKELYEALRQQGQLAVLARELEQRLGLAVTDLESVTLLVLPPAGLAWPEGPLPFKKPLAWEQGPPLQPGRAGPGDPLDFQFAVVLTTDRPYDRQKLLRRAVRPGPDDDPFQPPGAWEGVSMQLLNERSLLVGGPLALVYYADLIAAEKQGKPGALQPVLALGGKKHALVAGCHLPPGLRRLLARDFIPLGMPRALATVYPLLNQPVGITAELGPDSADLEVSVFAGNPRGAALATEAARAALACVGLALEEMLRDGAHEPLPLSVRDLLAPVQQALADAQVTRAGNTGRVRARLKMDPAAVQAALGQGLRQLRAAASRQESQNNLRQIGLAMHNYHDVNKRLPPANFDPTRGPVGGQDGKPMLSWRVAILPFIEEENLYRQFNLDEPWDSAHNKTLIERMPKVYTVPGRPAKGKGLTHYQVFVGPRTVFGTPGMNLLRITDGTSNTLMVVEAAEPVVWTRPDDLHFDPHKPLPKLGGLFPGGFNAAMCDGAVYFLSNKLDEQTLRNLIMPDDGMVIPPETFGGRAGRSPERPSADATKASSPVEVRPAPEQPKGKAVPQEEKK